MNVRQDTMVVVKAEANEAYEGEYEHEDVVPMMRKLTQINIPKPKLPWKSFSQISQLHQHSDSIDELQKLHKSLCLALFLIESKQGPYCENSMLPWKITIKLCKSITRHYRNKL